MALDLSGLQQFLKVKLAPGWVECVSKRTGRTYYLHTDSNATRWTPPTHDLSVVFTVAEILYSDGSHNHIAHGIDKPVTDALFILQKHLAENLGLYDFAPRKICDLGCGPEPKVAMWRKADTASRYVGVELSESLATVAHKQLGYSGCAVVVEDATSAHFTVGLRAKLGEPVMFDFVLSWMGAMEFCSPGSMVTFFKNVGAIMKDTGSALVLTLDADVALEAMMAPPSKHGILNLPKSMERVVPMMWMDPASRIAQLGDSSVGPTMPTFIHTQTEIAEFARLANLRVKYNHTATGLMHGMLSRKCPLVGRGSTEDEYVISNALRSCASQLRLFRVFVLEHAH